MDNEADRQHHEVSNALMMGVLEEALHLTERGFKLPIHIVLLGINGSLLAFRCKPGKAGEKLTGEHLAGHDEGGGFAFPINVMLVDAVGEAARMLIRASDVKPEVVH